MKNSKLCKWGCSVVFGVLLLTGCSTTELEERCFPAITMVGVEDKQITYHTGFPKSAQIQASTAHGSTFEEAKASYESRLHKQSDYNHLKVLMLEDDLLENTAEYNTMLAYLAATEVFPRNTYVCVVDDVEDFKELEQNLAQDLGTYLEEYLKKHEERKGKLLTLGDLIDENANQEFVLYLPYLETEENYVEWKGYMNNSGKIWQESN